VGRGISPPRAKLHASQQTAMLESVYGRQQRRSCYPRDVYAVVVDIGRDIIKIAVLLMEATGKMRTCGSAKFFGPEMTKPNYKTNTGPNSNPITLNRP